MWHSPFSAFITRLTFYNFFPSESNTRSINFYWDLYKHLSELEVFKATYHLDVVLACIILLHFPPRSHTCYSRCNRKVSQTAALLRDSERGMERIALGKCGFLFGFFFGWVFFFKLSEPGKKTLISLRVKRSQKSFLSHFNLFKKTSPFCHSML